MKYPIGLIPYLSVKGASEAIEFYKKAFGAEEVSRTEAEGDTRLMHAWITVNGSNIYLSDEFPEHMGGPLPAPSGVGLHLQVEDANSWWQRAVDAGATVTMPLEPQFWGDIYGQLKDPYGFNWSIAQTIEQPA